MRYYLLVGVIAIVTVAWSGGWFYLADQTRTDLQRRANQSTHAREVTYRDVEVTGFPFRLQVNMSMPRIVLRGEAVQIRWTAERIKAVGHPWQPRHILLDLTGQHEFKVNLAGRSHQITLENGTAMASLETATSGRLQRLSLDLGKVQLRFKGAPGIRVGRAQFHARPAPGKSESMDLALHADALEVDEGALPASLIGMPRTAELIDLQATVTGLPKGEFMAGQLQQWRDGGGTLEINALNAQWGDIEISASGSLALDGQMRPIGALTARIKGHEELLDMFVVTGMMKKNAVATARAVLGLLAAAGGGVLSVPVRLQDGLLYLGPAAVARLVPVIGQ